MGKNKGKKKQQQQGEEQAAASEQPIPGLSGGGDQPTGQPSKKGGKKKQQQGEGQAAGSERATPGPSIAGGGDQQTGQPTRKGGREQRGEEQGGRGPQSQSQIPQQPPPQTWGPPLVPPFQAAPSAWGRSQPAHQPLPQQQPAPYGQGQSQPVRGAGRGQPQQGGRGQKPGQGQMQTPPGMPQPQRGTEQPTGPQGGRVQQQPGQGQMQVPPGMPQPQRGTEQPRGSQGGRGQQQPGQGQMQAPAGMPQPQRGAEQPRGSQGGRGQQQPGQGQMQAPAGMPQPQRGSQGGRGQQPGRDQMQSPPAMPQPQRGAQRPRGQQPGSGPSRSPSESSVSSIATGVSKLSVSRQPFSRGDANIVSQRRFQPGRQGRVIKVESNHLQLNLGNIKTAYHYDVAIVPDTPKKFMRPVVEAFRKKYFPNRYPAFDGRKNLYTANRMLTDNRNDVYEDDIIINEEDGREKKFKVTIKFAAEVDMTSMSDFLRSPVTPQDAIQVVDIVLRMAPIRFCLPVGRSFFSRPTGPIIDLGEGMEMYNGFYQSAIRGWKPLLNIDVAHKAFPKNINAVDALVDLLNTGRQQFGREDLRSLQPYQEQLLNKYIKTLRVRYEIPGHPGSRKNYRVNGLGDSSSKAQFSHDGRSMTVQEYFFKFKNFRLAYPDLPTLWVGNAQRPDKVLLPLELCVILEGQAVNRKMTEQQTSKMIKYAATDTGRRKAKIMDGIRQANYASDNCIKEFGFSVGNEFQKLDARVLEPPALAYADRTVRVSKGVWRNSTFLKPVTINRWTFVNTGRYPPRPDDYRRMADLFEKCGREVGMTFASRAVEPFANVPGRQLFNDILQYFNSQKGKYDVIFVIVPDSGPQYSFVKKAAEIVVGCLTQCIKSVTVGRKMNPQTAVNILLKVNSKLNGINHTFSRETKPEILRRPVMIMGADVTHPGPDSTEIPSVAAVTASHDPKAFQYNICWRLQEPRVEIIEDLENITIEHLKFFVEQTKVKPEAIVFFRDGVSEGQFEQVKNEEIRRIRAACKRMQADGFEPKITFLVVQKRHHTRLFPLNPRDSEDRNCNVPAGTCVDSEITHPFMQDFYLVSHASIQGVAKPTKYCTLYDDNDMDNDQVEKLAYYLCHMFSRCNRSVSYPAPTYYAHLAAARAKVYIENDRLNMSRLRDEFEKYQIKNEIRKDLPMFFV